MNFIEAQKKVIEAQKFYNNGKYSNAFIGNVQGAAVSMDDVSPLEHKIPVRLESENVIPIPTTDKTKTASGVTLTDNRDGTYILNGTATANDVFAIVSTADNYKIKAGTYTVCGNYEGAEETVDNYIQVKSAEDESFSMLSHTATKTAVIPTVITLRVNIRFRAGMVFENTVVKPQLQKGTTATPWTPFVPDDTEVTVKSCGKNLISRLDTYPQYPVVNNAQPIRCVAGKTYTFSFETTYTKYRLMLLGTDINGVDFKASSTITDTDDEYFSGFYTGATGRLQNKADVSVPSRSYLCNKDCIINAVLLWNSASETGKTYTNYMLEVSPTPTPYEPYIEGETITTPLAEGAELKSIAPNMTITTDTNGLILNAEYTKDTEKVINNIEQGFNNSIGDINTALDSIIDIQNILIGGESV